MDGAQQARTESCELQAARIAVMILGQQLKEAQARADDGTEASDDSEGNDDHTDTRPTAQTPNGSTPAEDVSAQPECKAKAEPLDPELVGMSIGFKNLYSGKEDRRGRFQWQDTIPKNLGKPVEDAETQKWALIVRHVKVYSDPQKVLQIHSIVIQSPLLKTLLAEVLASYPGVTTSLQRLEFSGKFEPLIHRWDAFNTAIEALRTSTQRDFNKKPVPIEALKPNGVHSAEPENPETDGDQASDDTENAAGLSTSTADASGNAATSEQAKDTASMSETEIKLQHAELLHDVLAAEFQSVIDSSRDMKAKGVMTYDLLWTLFQPGHLIFARSCDGQDRVFKLQSTKYGLDQNQSPTFYLTVFFVDYDGARFGWNRSSVSISHYEGTKPIASLSALPLDLHSQCNEMKEKITERGRKVENFAGTHYQAYDGIGWKYDQSGQKEKHSVKGRIIIDAIGWNKYCPNHATYVAKFKDGDGSDNTSYDDDYPASEDDDDDYDESYDGSYDGSEDIPLNEHLLDSEEKPKKQPLSDEQRLLCTPLLRGYALKEKLWLNLFVGSVQEVTYNTRAFESLVLPENQKELILGFTSTQQAYRNSYDDVIEGKGRGIIILLCGPPGVGKTLTAESVAEEMEVPLFIMSAGDLGMDSRSIESRLVTVLEMCTRWNAILLLDEADVFLEERSTHDIERNKLVSIFLRVLEYHEGIMFLTTNRVQTFDPAFQSRIHISLNYTELSVESRRTVWQNFLIQHDKTQASARERPPKASTSAVEASSKNAPLSEEEAKARHVAQTQPHAITDRQLDSLSLMSMNGRQIKNVLKTAQLLASRKAEPLKHAHVLTVLEVTQHLHNAHREVESTRSTIYS